VARWSEWGIGLKCNFDILRKVDAASGCDLCGSWGPNHYRRHYRIHARWVALHIPDAATFGGLCIADWLYFHAAGFELHRELWCSTGSLVAATQTRNRFRGFPVFGVAALCYQLSCLVALRCSSHP